VKSRVSIPFQASGDIRDHRSALQSIIEFSQKRVRISFLMGEFGHAAGFISILGLRV
jgi:hypothetical protein